ncbi:MAG: PHP domain-containing protein, partial [Oscillospiraceae bacterium]|nr:PHP domain-containing protein [Oscillospiraceae bacterium]
MCDKIPFFDFFERFVPPREIGLALHDAEVLGGSLDAKNRAMEVDVRCGEPLPEALVATIRQLLMDEYDLRQLRLNIHGGNSAKNSGNNDVVMGKAFTGKVTPMEELNPKMGGVVVEGQLFQVEIYETRRPGLWMLTGSMTDLKSSVMLRRSLNEAEAKALSQKLDAGMWLRVQGKMELSHDGKEMQLCPFSIMRGKREERKDTAPKKRVELHLHTQMSSMDALTNTKSVIKQAISWGHPAIAITDHGVVQAFPDAWHTAGG